MSFSLLLIILLLILIQVALRYLTEISIIWNEELARLLYVWLILLTAVITPQLKVNYFIDKLGVRWKHVLLWFLLIVKLTILFIICVGSLGMIELTKTDTFTSFNMQLSYLYLAPLVSAILSILILTLRKPFQK